MIYIREIKSKVSPQELSNIARQLLIKGLKAEYGINVMPQWDYSVTGKPFFKDFQAIHFNISHCDRAVVCAISNAPIGIDVECINSYDEELARYISSDDEFCFIQRHPNPALAFTMLWTKKESCLKLTGKGLGTRDEIKVLLNGNKCHFETMINESSGYVMTYCRNENILHV